MVIFSCNFNKVKLAILLRENAILVFFAKERSNCTENYLYRLKLSQTRITNKIELDSFFLIFCSDSYLFNT